MTTLSAEERADKDMLKGDISALCWLKCKAELAGRGVLDNLDARAVLRAIHQAEQAARADERRKVIEVVEVARKYGENGDKLLENTINATCDYIAARVNYLAKDDEAAA